MTQLALTQKERTDLALNIQVIREGEKTFLEVGRALADIQNRKLYREKYATFEDFIETELGYSRRYGYFLKQGAEIADDVNNCTQTEVKITRESQARPLQAVPKEARAVVWEEAVRSKRGKPPTARDVTEAARAYQRKQPRKRPTPPPRPEPFKNEVEILRFLRKVIPPILLVVNPKDISNYKEITNRGGLVGVSQLTERILARILSTLESEGHVALCPPEIEDVLAYAEEANLPDHADDFLDHYQGNGWVAGSNLVTDWRSKYRQWCRRQPTFKDNGKQHQFGTATDDDRRRIRAAAFSSLDPDA